MVYYIQYVPLTYLHLHVSVDMRCSQSKPINHQTGMTNENNDG